MLNSTETDELLALDKAITGEIDNQDAALREELERLHWRNVMDSTDGAHVLRAILAETHLFRTTYVRGDAQETAFQEGKRAVGLWLLAKLGRADKDLAKVLVTVSDQQETNNVRTE